MLSKNLHWACSIFEMFFFCISHWPVCFFFLGVWLTDKENEEEEFDTLAVENLRLKPREQIKLKLQSGKCNLIK